MLCLYIDIFHFSLSASGFHVKMYLFLADAAVTLATCYHGRVSFVITKYKTFFVCPTVPSSRGPCNNTQLLILRPFQPYFFVKCITIAVPSTKSAPIAFCHCILANIFKRIMGFARNKFSFFKCRNS